MKEILGNGETDDIGLLRSRPVCLLSAHLLRTGALDAANAGGVLLQYWQGGGAETVLLKCECAEAFIFIM